LVVSEHFTPDVARTTRSGQTQRRLVTSRASEMRRTASSPRTPTAPGRASASWMTDLVPATDETEERVDAPRRPNTCPRNPRHPRLQRRRLRRSCVVASAALSTTVPLWASSSSATSAAFAAAFTGDRSPDAGDRFRFPTAAQATIGLPSRASWPGASGLPHFQSAHEVGATIAFASRGVAASAIA
jgi:hypothetical protein